MNKETIICERLKRQGFTNPLKDSQDIETYMELFQLLQPVSPVFNSRPGSPPELVHRTTFDDSVISEKLRSNHKLVKARFQGGRIGYVLEEDLSLYGSIYRKPIQNENLVQEEILTMIRSSGGISKDQLKEELPFKAKDITAALKRLQEAFLVYESQVDTDWNTGWFDFSSEWPDVNLELDLLSAVSEVLLRFFDAIVFATLDQIKAWSQLKIRTIQRALDLLVERGEIVKMNVDSLGEGFIQKKDLDLTEEKVIPKSVFMLDKSDFLARTSLNELKQKFVGSEVLQYLLIDGEFKGAVLGHWRIGPHDIEDIELLLDQEDAVDRKTEIIDAVRTGYSEERTAILRFNGEE